MVTQQLQRKRPSIKNVKSDKLPQKQFADIYLFNADFTYLKLDFRSSDSVIFHV